MTPFRPHRRRRLPSRGRVSARRDRSGAVTLELILTFPILLIAFLAVIEFGMMYSTSQYVSYASRFGAKLAAETPATYLSDYNLSSGGSRLRTAINKYLNVVGLDTGACRVILQHDVPGASNPVQQDYPSGAACNCAVPTANLPKTLLSHYVRVTVCVPLEGNIPDLLCTFGFSIADCTFEESTTFIFEDFPVPTSP